MKLPHLIHRDPQWWTDGLYNYHQCKVCRARRTQRCNSRMGGPVEHGWPDLYDSHMVRINDSGWHAEPAGGWPPRDTSRIKLAPPLASPDDIGRP